MNAGGVESEINIDINILGVKQHYIIRILYIKCSNIEHVKYAKYFAWIAEYFVPYNKVWLRHD